jgi:hypothetical protein
MLQAALFVLMVVLVGYYIVRRRARLKREDSDKK